MGFQPNAGVFNRRNHAVFFHRVVLGAGGAIASQDAPADSGVVATKTATKTGRYTLQLPSKYRRLLWVNAAVIGTDDAAYTTAKGLNSFVRDNDVDGGAADGTVEVQFNRTDTAADAEVIDSATLLFRVEVEF